MLDKQREQQKRFQREDLIRKEERISSFSNTGALLTKNNKVILPHADDADYSSDTACVNFLRQRLKEIGPEKLAEEAGISLDNMVDRLISFAGEDNCLNIVRTFFTKEVL